MTETQYWQRHLQPLLKQRVYAWKIAARYVSGIPDWWASGSKGDIWVENKRIVNDPKTPPAVIDLTDHEKYLSVAQQQWLENRHNEGRQVGVVLFSRLGHAFFPGLSWQTPITGQHFIARAMTKHELAEQIIEIIGEKVVASGLH